MISYEAAWGRYAVHRLDVDGRITLRDLDRDGAFVVVDAEKLAREYKEVPGVVEGTRSVGAVRGERVHRDDDLPRDPVRDALTPRQPKNRKTKANAALAAADLFANPIRPDAVVEPLATLPPPVVEIRHADPTSRTRTPGVRDRDDDHDHHRPPASPRSWISPALTLGAVPPGGSKVSWPTRLLQYWMPCVRPADDGSGPHCWFIADNLDPHVYCDDCRACRPGSEAASIRPIPADHPRAQAWSLWSWAAPELPPPELPELPPPDVQARPLPAAGLPPWADDMDGKPLWERVGGKRGLALQEVWSERAAIHEYLGLLTREYAEYLAYSYLLDESARHGIG